MISIKKHVPNFLTLLNLFSGCVGISMAAQNELHSAALWIWIAAVFDFLDGAAARMLNVKSAIGKDLDSLADVVSFGALPSFILFKMISATTVSPIVPYAAFIVAMLSALRLARFNHDERQTTDFIGLPTPANAILISSFPFINSEYQPAIFSEALFLVALAAVLAATLVARVRLFSFKFRGFGFRENWVKYVYLALCVVLLAFLQLLAIPLVVVLYFIFSVILNYFSKQKR